MSPYLRAFFIFKDNVRVRLQTLPKLPLQSYNIH